MPDRDWMRARAQFALPRGELTYEATATWTVLSNYATDRDDARALLYDVLGIDPAPVRALINLMYVARYWLGYDAETVLRALDPLRNREDIPA